MKARLEYDEAAVFSDARGNPRNGRRLGYRLEDGTLIEVYVTLEEYKNVETVKKKLKELVDAHSNLIEL